MWARVRAPTEELNSTCVGVTHKHFKFRVNSSNDNNERTNVATLPLTLNELFFLNRHWLMSLQSIRVLKGDPVIVVL